MTLSARLLHGAPVCSAEPVRLAYLGTPQIAVPPLKALHDAGHDIVAVVTRPDARRGRGGRTTPSPVKAAALELGLHVVEDPAEIVDAGAERGVVVAYGRIIAEDLLARVPMLNLHFSLLPRWRGAAPVERALLAGDEVTGVTLMELDAGLDTGPVYEAVEVPIGQVTAAELRDRLTEVGSAMLVEALGRGLGTPVPQPSEGVTYADKLDAEDLRIDWSRPAQMLARVVRVGGAWTTLDGDRFKIHAVTVVDDPAEIKQPLPALAPGEIGPDLLVGTGAGLLRLDRVQPAGRAAMVARDWANGARPIGRVLGR